MRFFILLLGSLAAAYGSGFTTYIGDQNQYQVAAIATDSAGNTYVTGSRIIDVSPYAASSDVFVTKLDAQGNLGTTTFGGKGVDRGNAIAVDSEGNIWVGGSTSSENFPIYGPAVQRLPGTGTTGFLVKLAPNLTALYSSYFGGLLGASSVNGIAVDQAGSLYVTGITDSSDFNNTKGLPGGTVTSNEITPVSGAFIAKLPSNGELIIYAALIAGTAVDCSGGSSCFLSARTTTGVSIAVDPAGEAFIAGNSNTTDLPVTPGGASGFGAFAAKINAAGSQLVYLTYLAPPSGVQFPLGPSEYITAGAVAADASGNAYLTGSTDDPEFPATAGAYQTELDVPTGFTGEVAPSDAFAIKLSPVGAVLWATYLGGPAVDQANSIGLDGSGNVWLAGTNGGSFPSGRLGYVVQPGDFLAELSADGSKLLDVVEFPSGAAGQALVVDASGVLHYAGATGLISTITPAQPSTSRIVGIANAAAGQVSGRISAAEVISIFGFGLGPATPISATPTGGAFPTSLGGVQVLVNGTAIPLLYVSWSQINAEIPAPIPGSADGSYSTVVQIVSPSATLPVFRVSVDASIFEVFTNQDGSVAAINQDGTINSASNPAKSGSIVSIWGTGFGNAFGPVAGAVATAADNWCSYCQVSEVINGEETVQYAGAAPGLIDGLMQINFTVLSQSATSPSEMFFEFSLGGSGYVWVSQ